MSKEEGIGNFDTSGWKLALPAHVKDRMEWVNDGFLQSAENPGMASQVPAQGISRYQFWVLPESW
jgi:hypothetical protein